MRLPRLNNPLPPRQRGAYVVLTAVVMLSLVLSVGLALDTGRLHLEKRQLQRVADMAALEAAGAVPLISHAEDGELEKAAREATKRNGYKHNTDDQPSDIDDIRVEAKGGGVCHEDQGGDGGLIRKFYPFDGGETKPAGACSELERHAVEVTIEYMASPSLFGSLWGDGGVEMTATAMAQRSKAEQFAVFSVGSRLLSVDTNDSILASLIGGLLEVDAAVVGFGGIADATVTLSDLLEVSELGVGSAEELLSAELTLLDLVEAVVTAVDESGTLGLDVFAGLLGGLPVSAHLSGARVTLGEILGVTTDTIPLMAELDVPGLLSTALLVASQESGLALPGLELNVPGVANIDAMLKVIEPPQIAIGPAGCLNDVEPNLSCNGEWKTEARTAQLTLAIDADVEVPLLAKLGVKLGVTAAGARAGIEDISPAGEHDEHEWNVTVAAYQAPLSAPRLDLHLRLLDTPLPFLDDLGWSEIEVLEDLLDLLEIPVDIVSSLVGVVAGLLSSILELLLKDLVGGLIGGLLDLLSPYYDVQSEYYDSDQEKFCVKVERFRKVSHAFVDSDEECKPASEFAHLLDDVPVNPEGGTSGWEEILEAWVEPGVAKGRDERMGESIPDPPVAKWPAGNSEEEKVIFTGDLGTAVAMIGELEDSVDVKLELLGADLSANALLGPVLRIVDEVAGKVLSPLVGLALDPVLDALGVNVSEAEVRIIHIDQNTGPPELL